MNSSPKTFAAFADKWQANAQLALDTIAMRPTRGIPTWLINDMQWSHLEEFTGNPPGSYPKDPIGVYLQFQRVAGACFIDQWIPTNPLRMQDQGFQPDTAPTATTGAETIIRNGMLIDSPEAAVEHMEKHLFPEWQQWRQQLEATVEQQVLARIAGEVEMQELFGTNMLKGPYGKMAYKFPGFLYGLYGYANYFMAYALYPEIIERGFAICADAALVHNQISARAIIEGGLPRLVRLDHDMADSRGTLVDIKSLDRMWFPHFARCIQPFLDADIRMIWHCDGNLMQMVPRLIEAGVRGFQGFQYEDGMQYETICKMTDRDGGPLFIIGGASVTTTLPMGKPDDVKRELDWLVKTGPKVGLMLGCSSSIAPGVPKANIAMLLEGLNHYRNHGRGAV